MMKTTEIKHQMGRIPCLKNDYFLSELWKQIKNDILSQT